MSHHSIAINSDIISDSFCGRQQRNTYGAQKWSSKRTTQKYSGFYHLNNLHGPGMYLIENPDGNAIYYEGSFHINKLEGYGHVIYNNGPIFDGLFKNHYRFGPGIVTHANGTQDVGIWEGFHLRRLSLKIGKDIVPNLGITHQGKNSLLKYRRLVPIYKKKIDYAKEILEKLDASEEFIEERSRELYNIEVRTPESIFLDQEAYNQDLFNEEQCTIEVPSTPEEFEEEKEELEAIQEKCPCMDEFSQVCVLLHQVEEKLEVILAKKHQIEETINGPAEEAMSSSDSVNSNEEYFQQLVDSTTHFLRSTLDVLPNLDQFEQTQPQKECLSEETLQHLHKCIENLEHNEMFYESIKRRLSRRLDVLYAKKNQSTNQRKKCRRVLITDLLAWNNDEFWIRMLQFTFLHHKSESTVPVADILAGRRQNFLKPGNYEENCINFLEECLDGNKENLPERLKTINPDLCDSRGNTGLMLATISDNVRIIKLLVKCGAKVNTINDEGLTPLTISLLRLLTIQFRINNWERAFLPEINHDGNSHAEEVKKTMNYALTSSTLNSYEAQDENQVYIFNVEYVKVAHPIKPKKKEKKNKNKKDKKEKKKKTAKKPKKVVPLEEKVEESCPNLEELANLKFVTIVKTVGVLLELGSDPNFGDVPIKAIFLAIFTDRSKLVRDLLEKGANPNSVLEGHGLTPLQVICSLILTEDKLEMCRFLLEFGGEPNVLTPSTHWSTVMPILKHEEDEGKTLLHMLAIREDFINQNVKLLKEITQLLLKVSKPDELYKGHTPLSLAIYHNNLILINALLKSKTVNPYKKLGNKLGNVLTFLLNTTSYSSVWSKDTQRVILDLLLSHQVNPLNPVSTFDSTIHFLIEVRLQNPKKPAPSPIELHLRNETRKFLFRHLQGRVVEFLYTLMTENIFTHPLVKNLTNFVTFAEALKCVILLFENGCIEKCKFSKAVILDMLEFISLGGDERIENLEEIEETLNDVIFSEEVKDAFVPLPEIDPDFDKFQVCFECLRKSDSLVLCPKCHLVSFCSEECNLLNIHSCNLHKCNLEFVGIYGNLYPESTDYWIILRGLAEQLRKEREALFQLSNFEDEIKFLKLKTIEMKKKLAQLKNVVANLTLQREAYTKEHKLEDYINREKWLKEEWIQEITASLSKESSLSDGKTVVSIFTPRSRSRSQFTEVVVVVPKKRMVPKKVKEIVPKMVKNMSEGERMDEVLKLRHSSMTKRYCLEMLSNLFSDFNLSLMFLPYACFKDGQVYYSMSDSGHLENGFQKLQIPD